jgi:hypothetical protein
MLECGMLGCGMLDESCYGSATYNVFNLISIESLEFFFWNSITETYTRGTLW